MHGVHGLWPPSQTEFQGRPIGRAEKWWRDVCRLLMRGVA